MKKIFKTLVVSTALIAGFVACSDKKEGQSSKNGVKELVFWRPQADASEDKWYADRISEYNEMNRDKVKITMETISRGNSFAYEDKINTNAVSNTLPDIVSLDGPNVANYAYSRIVVPMDEYFTSEEKSDYLPSVVAQGTYQDKFYAVGMSESSVVLFYNRKLIKDLGIEIDETGDMSKALTMAQVYDMSKLAKEKLGIWGMNWINDKGEWMTYSFGQFWNSNGADIISEDGWKSTGFVNSKKGIEAGKYIQKFATEEIFNIDPLPTEFQLNQSLFMLGGTWNIKGFHEYKDLDWGMTYFPYFEKMSSPSGSWALGITKDSKHGKEASDFIKFMTNKENSIAFSKAISMPPSRKSALNEMEEYNQMPYLVVKNQLLKTATPRPITPVYTILTAKFTQAILDIMLGADIEKSLDKVATDVDESIRRTYKK